MKLAHFATLFALFIALLSNAKTSPNLKIGESKSFQLSELKKELGDKSIKVNDPYNQGWVSEFKGFPLTELLDKYLRGWRDSDAILATALDNYKLTIPVSKIIKYNPYLVYSFSDPKKNFVFDNPSQNAKNVNYGPYYIVWDNINHPNLKRSGYYDWTWKIIKLESIQYGTYYAKAFPLLNPTPNQKSGFEYYKAYCISCHSVTGEEGGSKSAPLLKHPLFEKNDLRLFSNWVLNPKELKKDTSMPALNMQLTEAERNEVTALIYDYLMAVRNSVKK